MLYHDIGGNNKAEFTAYRMLYYMYTQEMTDLTAALAALTNQEKEDECISHVIKLRQAWVGSPVSFILSSYILLSTPG